jgi:3-deoxy-D-manno-octulosonic-acid transferase
VAGSTWPADEAVLLEAWEQLRTQSPAPRLIIAPHEPTASHIAPLQEWAKRTGLPAATLSELEQQGRSEHAEVVIVDRVGVLGDLYALADLAFVGGGFHSAGLHSVIEPAAFGVPVLFGPQHHMSREASLLLEAGGAFSVNSAQDMRETLQRLLQCSDARHVAGAQARAVVQAERGATAKSLQLVEQLAKHSELSPQA